MCTASVENASKFRPSLKFEPSLVEAAMAAPSLLASPHSTNTFLSLWKKIHNEKCIHLIISQMYFRPRFKLIWTTMAAPSFLDLSIFATKMYLADSEPKCICMSI